MSKHHKHHHGAKSAHKNPNENEAQNVGSLLSDSAPSVVPTSEPSKKEEGDEKGDEKNVSKDEGAEDDKSGVFENLAALNPKKSGGHEPVDFVPANPPMDHSAAASISAHEAAQEDKDPEDVAQELTHEDILAGKAGAPSAPADVTKDLPDNGKNPDAEVTKEGGDEKKPDAGDCTPTSSAASESPVSQGDLSAPSAIGSAQVDATDKGGSGFTPGTVVDSNNPAPTASSATSGSTPSAS